MAQLIDLGKLRFNFTGNYGAGTTYEYNDVVAYGANSYVYINSVASAGNLPTDTDFWAVVSTGVQFEGDWSSSTAYQKNDIVKYGPKSYIAIQDSTNIIPDTETHWALLNDGLGFVGDWETATVYFAGDVVNRGGIQYVAILHHTSGTFETDLAANKWEQFLEGFRYRGDWTADTAYLKNDIVLDGLNSYIATNDFTSNSVDFSSETPGDWDLFTPGTDVLPAQLGQQNKILTTDGTDPYWTADPLLDTVEVENKIWVGPDAKIFDQPLDTEAESLTNAAAVFRIETGEEQNSYGQVAIQNNDPTSSTDLVIYSSDGYDSAGWMSVGFTGPDFGDPEFTLTNGHDGYIFVEPPEGSEGTGNLILATGANGSQNHIVFAAGGFNSGLEQMTIIPDEQVHIEIATESTSPTTGALRVGGGMGISGNANILGDVFINGSLTVSGGAFETTELISSAPILTTGIGATNNTPDRGFMAEYKKSETPVSFDIGTVQASGGTGTITRKGYTTLTKAITDNVATITIQEASHSILNGETVVIANLGAPYDGTHTVTGVTGTTFSYAVAGSNQSPTADTDGTVTVNVPTSIINGDSLVIADCNITAFNGQRNFVKTVSGNTVTFDFTGTQALTTVTAGTVTVNSKTKFTGLVRNQADSKWYFIDNVPPVNVAGVNTAPTSDINFADVNLTYPTFVVGGLEFLGTPTIDGNITFSGSTTFTTVAGNATFSGNPTFSGAPIFSGTPVFTGGIRVQEMVEDVVDVSPSSNTYTLDYTTGNIFYSTGALSANFTINMTNVPTTSGRVFTVNLITTQGATGYRPGTLNINGSGVTIKWAGGITPTPTSSSGKLDIFTFTIVRRGSAYECLASANLNF